MQFIHHRFDTKVRWLLAIMCGGALVIGPSGVMAKNTIIHLASQSKEAQQVNLVVGKSTVVDMPVAIKRASLADPHIADAMVLTPKQIYVTGKGYGTTNLTLWGQDGAVIAILDLDVGVDLIRLKQQLAELLPDEMNIRLRGTHDHVTVFGTISSEARLGQVLAVAEAYAPKKVLNFLKVYPEPPGSKVRPDVQTVTVEVIKGTSVNAVKF
ncbi:pilus assembly protein N-terminal domain-containing protein [Nitrospira sp. BLG_1]|uniref:pilus assembly protein N-terminal domain-containing protein n=1 Tax=Nitrospira sp. BLG_1 TaxID=3395883 RepID=UPI0039BCE797